MEEPCRRLLTHLFYEEELWSYEEIAEELGLSVSTIGPKRGRCLKKLLKILNEMGF
jgi:DNA-directed RNA polymerase specialized sigma24 family protein